MSVFELWTWNQETQISYYDFTFRVEDFEDQKKILIFFYIVAYLKKEYSKISNTHTHTFQLLFCHLSVRFPSSLWVLFGLYVKSPILPLILWQSSDRLSWENALLMYLFFAHKAVSPLFLSWSQYLSTTESDLQSSSRRKDQREATSWGQVGQSCWDHPHSYRCFSVPGQSFPRIQVCNIYVVL